MFNEADFKCAVSEIMIQAKKESFPVFQKLRDQLQRSSTEIFPFFEACLRKVHKTRQLRCTLCHMLILICGDCINISKPCL